MKIKSNKSSRNQNPPVKIGSLHEAEEKIYSDIQLGMNPREIVKTKFMIDGKLIGFNISQVKKIKSNFESKLEKPHHDPDKAKVFKLFKSGMHPTDVIIKTELSYDFVKQSWDEYSEINEQELISKSFIKNVKEILKPINTSTSLHGLESIMKEAVMGWIELDEHAITCAKCGEIMCLDTSLLDVAQKYLQSKNYCHDNCEDWKS